MFSWLLSQSDCVDCAWFCSCLQVYICHLNVQKNNLVSWLLSRSQVVICQFDLLPNSKKVALILNEPVRGMMSRRQRGSDRNPWVAYCRQRGTLLWNSFYLCPLTQTDSKLSTLLVIWEENCSKQYCRKQVELTGIFSPASFLVIGNWIKTMLWPVSSLYSWVTW